ncbi:hypothetical protein C8J56DRAFT_1031517 [Mycena floridula]|nr:hypothetical protein C8J56DRAFT_1031517 [Mycena floridula]
MPPRKTTTTNTLQRGLACLCCRKRKLKCDGTRPVCRQCTKADKVDECQYDDHRQKSRTQKLREKLTMLEERIRELESDGHVGPSSERASSSSDTLDLTPYQDIQASQPWPVASSSSSSPAPSSAGSLTASLAPPGTSSRGSSVGFGPHLFDDLDLDFASSQSHFDFNLSNPIPRMSHWDTKGPLPEDNKTALFEIFMAHRHQCWFDTDASRIDISQQAASFEPHPALMNSIYLIACHFAHTPYCTEIEPVFLSRARHEITVALDKSDRLVDIVQASCLLAVYSYTKGRPLEGYCHSFTATRLAVGLGLHQINPTDSGKIPDHPAPIQIPPPRDHMELRERIAAFWQVFMVDRCWSVASGLPVALPDVRCPQSIIKTPWQRSLTEPPITINTALGANTIFSIYQIQGAALQTDMSFMPSLKAKAAAVFERSYRLSASNPSNKGGTESYWVDYNTTKAAIVTLQSQLTPFIGYDSWRHQAPYIDVELFTVHTLAHTAALHLLPDFEMEASNATNSVLALIRQLSDADYEYLDPIVSSCWLTVAKVYIRGIASPTQHAFNIAMDPYAVMVFEQELQLVMHAIMQLSKFFPLAGEHAKKLEEERQAMMIPI